MLLVPLLKTGNLFALFEEFGLTKYIAQKARTDAAGRRACDLCGYYAARARLWL